MIKLKRNKRDQKLIILGLSPRKIKSIIYNHNHYHFAHSAKLRLNREESNLILKRTNTHYSLLSWGPVPSWWPDNEVKHKRMRDNDISHAQPREIFDEWIRMMRPPLLLTSTQWSWHGHEGCRACTVQCTVSDQDYYTSSIRDQQSWGL